jgi:uncharacterized protein (TIGR02466 family)
MNVQLKDCFPTPIYSSYLDIDTNTYIEKVYQEESKSKGRRRSNTGWQSLDIDVGQYKELFDKINPHIVEYYKIFNCSAELHMSDAWFNINRYKDMNATHHHASSAICGVLYFKVPENSGDIGFENPNPFIGSTWIQGTTDDTLNKYNAETIYYKSEEKLLILFPGYLAHEFVVDPGLDDFRFMHFNLQAVQNEV